MLKKFPVFGVVLIAVFSFALMGCGNTAVSTDPGKITLEKFNQIQQGMTYQEVTQILGREGELINEAGSMRMYMWTNKDEVSNMNVTLNDNRVIAKAQMGLQSSGNPQQTQAPVQNNKTVTDADKQRAIEAYERGKEYRKNKDYASAITSFNQAIQLVPEFVDAYNSRGCAYYDLNQYDKAIADFTSAIQLDPKYTKVYTIYNNRGCAYDKLSQYDKAIADYKKVLELKPDHQRAKERLQKALDAKANRR